MSYDFDQPSPNGAGPDAARRPPAEARSGRSSARPVFAASSNDDGSGAIRIVFTGELDMATAPAAEQELRRAESERRPVVLDLRRLRFMDSSGLRLIMAADRRIRALGGRLVVVRGPLAVHRVFEITRLDGHFEMVDEPAMARADGA